MILIVFFIFGIFIGSFLNVCIYRFNTGFSISKGRSKCFSCGSELKFYELVPILSFLFQGGRCLSCKSKISFQYPLVEFFTGILFVVAYLRNVNPFFTFLDISIFCFLIMIFVYDLKHKIIPDFFVYTFILLSVVKFLYKINISGFSLLDSLVPFLFFIFFWLLWFISSGRWIGFADSKLVLGIGFFLGLIEGLSAVILSFWVGAIYSIFLLLMQKMNIYKSNVRINRYTEIPFAPFLVFGTIIEYLYSFDILHLSYFLN